MKSPILTQYRACVEYAEELQNENDRENQWGMQWLP